MKKKIEMLRKGPKEHFTGPKKYVFVDKRVVKQQNWNSVYFMMQSWSQYIWKQNAQLVVKNQKWLYQKQLRKKKDKEKKIWRWAWKYWIWWYWNHDSDSPKSESDTDESTQDNNVDDEENIEGVSADITVLYYT